MNRRVLTILVAAFIFASGCAFFVYRIVGTRLAGSRPVPVTRVVAASGDVKLGTVLAAENLKTVEISGAVPKGVILKREDAIGRGVISNLYDGEPVMESRLATPGSGGGLAATIPSGKRACAVKVDDVVGVAGFATPGMRVDVLISGIPPNSQYQAVNQETVTKTVLQNIEVLSAGTDIQKDAQGKPKSVQVVNLLVTPEEAQTLSLASNVKIQLILRNPLDTKIGDVKGTAMGALFAGSNAAPALIRTAAKPRVVHVDVPRAFSVEVINGAKRSQEKFASAEESK